MEGNTPRIDESETIEFKPDTGEGRVRAASYLTILSRDTSPAELARLVGLVPDETWSKGDLRSRHGRRRKQPFNGISYESGLDEKQSPTDHLAALIGRLEPFAASIAEVAARAGTHSVRVSFVEHTERDNINGGAYPLQLAVLGRMGAELFIDVYFYDDDV